MPEGIVTGELTIKLFAFFLMGTVFLMSLSGPASADSLGGAVMRGDAAAVRVLLTYGADVNKTDKDGDTPLSEAASNNHAEIVKILLAHGATPTSNMLSTATGESKVLLQAALKSLAAQTQEIAALGEILSFLIGAAFVGIFPAYLAYKKGRNFFLWWFFGGAIFIIALPVALRDGLKKCPKCSEYVIQDAKVCHFCQFDFTCENS